MKNFSFLDKIQDITFDFYARLIPGIVTVAILQYYDHLPFKLTVQDWGALLVLAYLFGHFQQPWASCITRQFVKLFVNVSEYESIKGKSEPLSRNILVAEKAYAEAVGFMSIALSSLVLIFIIRISQGSTLLESYGPEPKNACKIAWISLFALSLTGERIYTRIRKIKRVIKIQQESSRETSAAYY